MNISDDEREILFTAITIPERQNTPGYSVRLFSGERRRKIAEAVSAIYENDPDNRIDLKEIEHRSGIPLEKISEEINSGHVLTEKGFQLAVNFLLRSQKTTELNGLLFKEIQSNLKTGTWSEEAQARIRELYRGIDELEKPLVSSCLRLSDVQPKTISWIRHGRIPLGMLTLIAGDPGLGKSFLSTWVCSRLSTGRGFPDNATLALSGGTIYLPAEDSACYAIRPRADANDADTSKIYILEDSSLDITKDLSRIRAKLDEDPGVKLLVIDPLNSFLGQADYFKDPSVRAVLVPLCRFIEEREIACIGIMHLNKKIDLGAIYRIGGSIAFAGVARSVLAVTPHPEDEDRRLLRSLKMNYAKRPGALSFLINDDLSVSFEDTPVLIDQNDALSQTVNQDRADNSFAAEWLHEHLADEGSELKELIKAAAEVGISRRTLFYCRKKLRIVSHTSGFGKLKISIWELPRE